MYISYLLFLNNTFNGTVKLQRNLKLGLYKKNCWETGKSYDPQWVDSTNESSWQSCMHLQLYRVSCTQGDSDVSQ